LTPRRVTRPITASSTETYDRCRRIYDGKAEAYDRLISAEDHDGNLLPAIRAVAPLDDLRILDVGAGTGRLARLLAPHCARMTATDRAFAMLEVARRRLDQRQGNGSAIAQSDARALPFPAGAFHMATAGWVFGHFTFWDPQDWRQQISEALLELERVVMPGGHVMLFENMGTASETAGPPGASLGAYYDWLVQERGFVQQVLATDFEFESVEAAVEACGFFFGPEFAERIRTQGWKRVPEWTGMWSKRVA
jgi:ubiquinone/menaquinone biosynthesis C-methylase UbiE